MLQLLKWNDKSSQTRAMQTKANEIEKENSSLHSQLDAISRSMAVITFDPTGIIVDANENFLSVVGYSLNEVVGKHHRIFLREKDSTSAEYSKFWSRLRNGEFIADEFPRLTKSKDEIWIQATYNPIFDKDNKVERVIKYASNVTESKMKWAALNSQAQAVDRCFAVIEFKLDGTIIRANQNFLNALGYAQHEIVGQHHRMFVTESVMRSKEYADFWLALNQGRYHQGEFHRVGKGGRDVYIQASYNPIFGINREITSIIKYATDITPSVLARQRIATVSDSVASSVSEMTQSIVEMSRNVSSTAGLAKDVESLASDTNSNVLKLGESSKTIGKVIELIRDLADQTNLLALNASIESARAGDAGRGFSVVAGEVKALARQTGVATQRIQDTVEVIQNSINEVVEAVNKISDGVSHVSSNMTTVSAAVEQQSATMNTIADTAQHLRATA